MSFYAPFSEHFEAICAPEPPLEETNCAVDLTSLSSPTLAISSVVPPNTVVPSSWTMWEKYGAHRFMGSWVVDEFKRGCPEIYAALKVYRHSAIIPMVAGSAVLRSTGVIATSKDVDVFLVRREGATDAEVEEGAYDLVRALAVRSEDQEYAYEVRRGLVSIFPDDEERAEASEVQVVLRHYDSPAAVFRSFDLQVCAFGIVFDVGAAPCASPLALWSALRRVCVADPDRCSATFDLRTVKYFDRGLGVHFARVPAGGEFAPASARTLRVPDDERSCGPGVINSPGYVRGLIVACGARRPCGVVEGAMVTLRLVRDSVQADYDAQAEPEVVVAGEWHAYGRVERWRTANSQRVALAARAGAPPSEVAARLGYVVDRSARDDEGFKYEAKSMMRSMRAYAEKRRAHVGKDSFHPHFVRAYGLKPKEAGAIAALCLEKRKDEVHAMLGRLETAIYDYAKGVRVPTWFINPADYAHGSPSHITVNPERFYAAEPCDCVVRPPAPDDEAADDEAWAAVVKVITDDDEAAEAAKATEATRAAEAAEAAKAAKATVEAADAAWGAIKELAE